MPEHKAPSGSREGALSVTEAMKLAKRALEGVRALVVGEVSEFTDRVGYKGVYFTLGDGESVMPCLVWRDVYDECGVQLACGALVEVSGYFTAYSPKGRMQFQVRTLSAAGEGVLRVKVAALARKLEAEGLMRPERKRPLPAFPARVAVVTSPQGKAIHDIIRTLHRRFPSTEVMVAGVMVEGIGAERSILHGVRVAEEAAPDVIILARGGGAYEDLMPFNSEMVARAVVECSVPVVTGIGHEPDTTIADMVADVRASTPTAAAEAAVPSADEVRGQLGHLVRRLARGLSHAAHRAEGRVRLLAHRPVLSDSSAMLARYSQALDSAAGDLTRALLARVSRATEDVDRLAPLLERAGQRAIDRLDERVKLVSARLGDLSPLGVLARGYAVCLRSSTGEVIHRSADVEPGDDVSVRLGEGALGCIVRTTEVEVT